MISAVPLQNALLMGGYGIGKQWSDDSQGDYDTMISVFVGGCTGGVVQSFIMSPVELIKVNQQVIGQPPKAARREIVQGLLSSHSWRGLTATLLRDGIPHGVWFASYEWCKTVLGPQLQDSSGAQVTIPLVSGAFAATVAWVRWNVFMSFLFGYSMVSGHGGMWNGVYNCCIVFSGIYSSIEYIVGSSSDAM